MNITRQHLHNLIDVVDNAELDIVHRILIKFIPEDTPSQDEIEAIKEGRESITNEGYIRHEDIDWS